MNKEELLEILSCIDHLTYCNRNVDKEKLMSIVDEFDDNYEEFDFNSLCFLSVLEDDELEVLEEIFHG